MKALRSIETAYRKSFVLNGRASRGEFAWFFLFYASLMGLGRIDLSGLLGSLIAIVGTVSFVPFVSAIVRRVHDLGYSGWFGLVWLVPLFGIVACSMKGNPGPNKYGEPVEVFER